MSASMAVMLREESADESFVGVTVEWDHSCDGEGSEGEGNEMITEEEELIIAKNCSSAGRKYIQRDHETKTTTYLIV